MLFLSEQCVCVRLSLSLFKVIVYWWTNFLLFPPTSSFAICEQFILFFSFNLPFYSDDHDFFLVFKFFCLISSSNFFLLWNGCIIVFGFSNLYFLWNSLLFPLQLTDGLCFFVFPHPSKFSLLCNGNGLFFFSFIYL